MSAMNVPEKVAALGKANLETALAASHVVLGGAERLAQINLNAARDMLSETVKSFHSASLIKDMQDLSTLKDSVAEPALTKLSDYSFSVYESVSQTHRDLTNLIEGHAVGFNNELINTIEQTLKYAPAGLGAEAAVVAVKSAVAAATSAYETVTKATKQVSDMTEANMKAMASKTVTPAKKKSEKTV